MRALIGYSEYRPAETILLLLRARDRQSGTKYRPGCLFLSSLRFSLTSQLRTCADCDPNIHEYCAILWKTSLGGISLTSHLLRGLSLSLSLSLREMYYQIYTKRMKYG